MTSPFLTCVGLQRSYPCKEDPCRFCAQRILCMVRHHPPVCLTTNYNSWLVAEELQRHIEPSNVTARQDGCVRGPREFGIQRPDERSRIAVFLLCSITGRLLEVRTRPLSANIAIPTRSTIEMHNMYLYCLHAIFASPPFPFLLDVQFPTRPAIRYTPCPSLE